MQKQLMVLRVIWAAMLIGEVTFMFIALIMGPKLTSETDTALLARVAAGMLVVMIPSAFVVRQIMYRGGSNDGVVTIAAYSSGNIIFWAMCEGVSFFGLVVTLLAGKPGLAFAVAVVAMAVQILNFPTGGPLDRSNV
jgi:hypothetical protein